MPRKSLGARLYLDPVRLSIDGKTMRPRVWTIRDGTIKRSTGFAEDRRLDAELALADYLARKPSGRSYFVYFLTAKAPDFPIKIGITERRLTRFPAIQGALPYELEVLALVRTDDPLLERRLHKRFADQRLRGEWFDRSPELMMVIDDLCRTHAAA